MCHPMSAARCNGRHIGARVSSNDPARDFFVLAHAVIASEMSVRAVQRRRIEPDDNDPLRFWYAWRALQDFESRPLSAF
jgi:hypothetical protein